MSVIISYSGWLKRMEDLPALVKEVRKICGRAGFDISQHSGKLSGISFAIPPGQIVDLTFNNAGRLRRSDPRCFTNDSVFEVCFGTQEAGVEIHIFIVKLLKYLGSKYFSSLFVMDWGAYWQGENLELLRRRFDEEDRLHKRGRFELHFCRSLLWGDVIKNVEKISRQLSKKIPAEYVAGKCGRNVYH